jgi:hypothetical protein
MHRLKANTRDFPRRPAPVLLAAPSCPRAEQHARSPARAAPSCLRAEQHARRPARERRCAGAPARRWTPLEQRELGRRRAQLLLYALRGPFFDGYTRCAPAAPPRRRALGAGPARGRAPGTRGAAARPASAASLVPARAHVERSNAGRGAREERSASGVAVTGAGSATCHRIGPGLLGRRCLLQASLASAESRTRARPAVETAQAWLRPVPLLGSLAGKAAEILCGITQYYTYTSAS